MGGGAPPAGSSSTTVQVTGGKTMATHSWFVEVVSGFCEKIIPTHCITAFIPFIYQKCN